MLINNNIIKFIGDNELLDMENFKEVDHVNFKDQNFISILNNNYDENNKGVR